MSDLDRDPLRIIRLRAEDSPAPRPAAARGTPRLVGRVVDGGAMPRRTGRVFLVNPARIDGVEAEGGAASVAADSSRSVPVVVIGSRVPAVGDALVAVSVGGRWVAESGPAPPPLACWPCNLPRKDLTVSWANPVLGDGSATLAYAEPGRWTSPCARGLIYRLACPGSIIQFGVSYFLSGECPGGQQQECSSSAGPPFALRLASSSCDPLYLRYTLTGQGCSFLSGSGYTSFTVTE